MDNNVNVQNMLWRPPLIRLTAANPVEGDPVSAALYVHPDQISALQRGTIIRKEGDAPYPCTIVLAGCFSHHVAVQESPDEVARLRDKAFGLQPKLTSV